MGIFPMWDGWRTEAEMRESTHKRYGCHKEGTFRPFVTDKERSFFLQRFT